MTPAMMCYLQQELRDIREAIQHEHRRTQCLIANVQRQREALDAELRDSQHTHDAPSGMMQRSVEDLRSHSSPAAPDRPIAECPRPPTLCAKVATGWPSAGCLDVNLACMCRPPPVWPAPLEEDTDPLPMDNAVHTTGSSPEVLSRSLASCEPALKLAMQTSEAVHLQQKLASGAISVSPSGRDSHQGHDMALRSEDCRLKEAFASEPSDDPLESAEKDAQDALVRRLEVQVKALEMEVEYIGFDLQRWPDYAAERHLQLSINEASMQACRRSPADVHYR